MIRHLSAMALAAVFALAVSGAAHAASVTFVGTFQENVLRTDDLTFRFMSDDPSVMVTSVTLDLSGGDGLVFDPPFTVAAAGGTGFAGMFQFAAAMPDRVTLNFGDFGSGETFAFRVDVDPGVIRGAEFAGSTLTFTVNTGDMFSGTFARTGIFTARVTINGETQGQGQAPEPASALLLGLGLSGLAIARRFRA